MEKISLISTLLVALAFSASAQFSKGTIFVGPTLGTNSYQSASDNLNYSSGNNNTRSASSKTYTLTIGPQLGVFITDHLVLGASVNYSLSSKSTTTNTVLTNSNLLTANAKTYTSTFTAGPFLRYYYFKTLSKNMFYTQLNGTLGTGSGGSSGSGNNNITSTYQSNGTINGIFSWNAGGSVGLTHFFNDFVGMDIAVGYSYTSTASSDQNNVNTTINATEKVTSAPNNYKETLLTHGVTLGLGFHWFFKKSPAIGSDQNSH
jgi:hypothetical protein